MGVHRSYSEEGKACLYAPGCLSSVKVTFLVGNGCTQYPLSETVLDQLPAAVRQQLEPWDTTATLADKSSLPIYDRIPLSRYVQNFFCFAEFLVNRISDEGILRMAFYLAGQKCTLCSDKGPQHDGEIPFRW